MNFVRPTGTFVALESKRRPERVTANRWAWRRAYLWLHLVDVGIPDPATRRPRRLTRTEVAKLFGVSRPLVSRWITAVRKTLAEVEAVTR